MTDTLTPRIVAIALVTRGTPAPRHLVARRRPNAHLGGSWELPGGRVELHETPEQTLARELREELGIDVGETPNFAPLTFSFHRYPTRTVLLLFFQLQLTDAMGDPQPLESDELLWLSRDELLDLPMPDANVPFKRWLASTTA